MSGTWSVANRMNSTGVGGRGGVRSVMLVSSSRRSPLRWLQGAQDVTTFSHTEVPPLARGDLGVVEREPVAPRAAVGALPPVPGEQHAA